MLLYLSRPARGRAEPKQEAYHGGRHFRYCFCLHGSGFRYGSPYR